MNQRSKRAGSTTRDILRLAFLALAGLAIAAHVSVAQSTASQTSPPLPFLTGDPILAHLDAVIGWYRDLATKSPDTGQPSDEIYRTNAQNLAAEATRLAFQSAEALAVVISGQTKKATAGQAAAGEPQNFSQMKARVAGAIAEAESQIEDLNRQMARSQGAKRESLLAKREALEGELELNRAVQQSVEKLSSFEGAGENTSDLLVNINQLKSSLPEVFGTAKPVSAPVSSQRPATPDTNGGLLQQAVRLYRQIRAMHTLDQLSTQTWHVREATDAVRLPLRQAISATVQSGRDLANQSVPNANIESIHKQFRQIIGQFNQLAEAAVPLAQEVVVLDQVRGNLSQWRAAMEGEFGAVLAALLIRAAAIAIALVLVFVVSEAWRRFTFRYVRDVRRRRQFLIARRFVVGFLFGLILILGFVSEFSSLATFAGFITAGVAVSLQAVLLSIAAYFFLVGRYGIRVGDRISVSGVVGDVVDIGLVRLYLMELADTGVDVYPTGRIVVFSNSVLFQATTPLFKQIPGTEFIWHEVAVTLAPTGDYKQVQEKVLAAVNAVWAKYREDLERQHRTVYEQIDFPLSTPEPKPTLQFGPAGLELQVRYPVNIRHASEVDDQLTRKLLDIVSSDAQLKASVTGSPQIRATVKG